MRCAPNSRWVRSQCRHSKELQRLCHSGSNDRLGQDCACILILKEVATRINGERVDVLLELSGFVTSARSGIVLRNPAPVQVLPF